MSFDGISGVSAGNLCPRSWWLRFRLASALLAAVSAGECAAGADAEEPSAEREWSVLRVGDEIAGEDSWRGFNHAMFGIQDIAMEYAVKPLNYVYCSILPKPLINGIDNALDNSEYPVRFFATLFRGEGGCAWDETKRFFVNTVLGVGGLFDPAKNWFGVFSTDASLSGTLAEWGVPKGNSLILPFVPRANVRDCAGYVLDFGLDPKTYIDIFFPTGIWIGWTTAFWPNYLAMAVDPWNVHVRQASDPYAAYRQTIAAKSLLDERLAVYHYLNELVANEEGSRRPPVREPIARPAGLKGRWRDVAGYEPRTPALDTMRQRLFSPARDDDFWWMRSSVFNGDFAKDVEARSVSVDTNYPAARYGFVPAAEQRGRLVFVVPGIGGAFNSDPALAMAELLHDAGAAVVTLDDPFHWRYVASANRRILPGNFPEDAKRLAALMREVVDDLRNDGLVDDPEVSVVGWSMGGLFTAYLAELEGRGELGFPAGAMLAVNPPVDSEHVLSAIDSLLAPTRSWTREEAIGRFVDVAPRLLVWDELRFDETPDISEEDAGYTVAALLVATIPELVGYVENAESSVTVRQYFDSYVKDHGQAGGSAGSARHVGLKSLENVLRGNARVKMIHTRDDFLLDAADRDFLDSALGDRITWFSAGAHCGMFHTPEFRQEALERLDLTKGR